MSRPDLQWVMCGANSSGYSTQAFLARKAWLAPTRSRLPGKAEATISQTAALAEVRRYGIEQATVTGPAGLPRITYSSAVATQTNCPDCISGLRPLTR